jgi:hypothetical protein
VVGVDEDAAQAESPVQSTAGQAVVVALEEAALGDDLDRCAEQGREFVDEVDLVEEGSAGPPVPGNWPPMSPLQKVNLELTEVVYTWGLL